MLSILAFYEEKVKYYTDALTRLRPYAAGVAVLRMVAFGGFAWGVYKWISVHNTAWILTTLLLAIGFAVLVRIAWRLNDRKVLLEKLLFINTNELNVLQNKPNQFGNGEEFLSYGSISGDLDVFGPGSLYLLLNRTTTGHGTKQLAGLLNEPLLNPVAIDDQQQAVRALSTQRDLGQLLTAHGLINGEKEGNMDDIGNWLQQPQAIHGNQFINILRLLTPLYSTVFLVYWLVTGNYALLAPVVLINWSIIGKYAKRIQQQHTLLGKKEAILNQYATILSLFTKVETGSSLLLKKEKDKAAEAHQTVKKLSRLAAMFDQRLNLFVNFFLNSFYMYDIQCLWALESWKQQHKDQFNEWIHSVGMIESLNSLSTFAYNNPGYQYATVNTDTLSISATQMAHPLIAAESRVANDCSFGINEKLVLVTGSNMSGKTTFLRTLGSNLILAQCGAPVCAASFSFTPMIIKGSIRVSDSLQEHTSYFMAELKRLQQIIQYLQKQNVPVMILIYEILLGTK